MPSVELDRLLVEAGIAMLDAGGDFADGVILAESRARADHLATFDELLAGPSLDARLIPGE